LAPIIANQPPISLSLAENAGVPTDIDLSFLDGDHRAIDLVNNIIDKFSDDQADLFECGLGLGWGIRSIEVSRRLKKPRKWRRTLERHRRTFHHQRFYPCREACLKNGLPACGDRIEVCLFGFEHKLFRANYLDRTRHAQI